MEAGRGTRTSSRSHRASRGIDPDLRRGGMAERKSALTDEIRALIGVTAERVEANLWGIEQEDLRRFTQAIMDPDPRYWDEAFAKTTRFGGVVAPPPIPTDLKRILNAGNEIELYKYPTLGDRIYSQAKIADVKERVPKDGSPMLIITTETTYTDQTGQLLCILRASTIRR